MKSLKKIQVLWKKNPEESLELSLILEGILRKNPFGNLGRISWEFVNGTPVELLGGISVRFFLFEFLGGILESLEGLLEKLLKRF